MKVRINRIAYCESLVDGPGLRSLVFFQGCDLHCKGCQNPSTWDPNSGEEMEVKELAEALKANCRNKKVTITGGEPLLQKEAVSELIGLLKGFDIALYTGHDISEVPQGIIDGVTYLKYGPFRLEQKTSTKPFVGSKNQVFKKVR
ncbi:MAG: radical SAM protein [Bacilli bacterium]|nr:radical SAM protein [Bacilli bacterium]